MNHELPSAGPDRDAALGALLGSGWCGSSPASEPTAHGAGIHGRRRESAPRWSTDRTASNRLAELMAARGYLLDARDGAGGVACYAFVENAELAAGRAGHGRYVTGVDRADALSAAALVALQSARRRAPSGDEPSRERAA